MRKAAGSVKSSPEAGWFENLGGWPVYKELPAVPCDGELTVRTRKGYREVAERRGLLRGHWKVAKRVE